MPVQTDKSTLDLERLRFDVTAFHDEVTNANLSGGSNTLQAPVAATGKMRKVTHVAFSYTGTVAGVRMEVRAGGKTVHKTSADPTSGKIETISPLLYLDAGERVELVVTGATATDDASVFVHGIEGIPEGLE